jgi:hypothetical protein
MSWFRKRAPRHLPVEPPAGYRWQLYAIGGGDQNVYDFELRLARLDGSWDGLMTYLVREREIRRASERILRLYERRERARRVAARVNG